ncbi:MAG: hypothetical protein ABWZ82_12250 [Candidatus Limnocylindrales bacterium]
MSTADTPVPGLVTDPAEVARFAAERDEDSRRERRLFVGQAVMLLAVLVVVAVLVAVQRA